MITVCVSYMRCSGDGQIQGDTWSRQSETIDKYATQNDLSIVRDFRDEGVTGKMELEGRSGLSECLQYVREHSIGVVLVEDSTRLARDMIVAEVLIREFQKLGVRVISASGGIDLTEGDDSNPTAKLIRQILAAVSEFERCCIVLKLRGARQRKRAVNGRCEGRKRFGDHPHEQPALAEIREMANARKTPKEIAAWLNRHGLSTRSGKPWHPGSVAKIAKRLKGEQV